MVWLSEYDRQLSSLEMFDVKDLFSQIINIIETPTWFVMWKNMIM